MNYRHLYHAGNFVDVVKHCVLTMILDYLRRKESPFCVIDTHAGEGIYDLTAPEAEKTGEAAAGVGRIIGHPDAHPQSMQSYLDILQCYQTDQSLKQYPGSPVIAYHKLREQDRLILNECHPDIYQRLKQHFRGKPRVAIHQRDAYEFLPAIVPPPIPRGVILIDPPFEQKEESQKIQILLEKCLTRWANGIYMVWYPIALPRSANAQIIPASMGLTEYLVADLTTADPSSEAKGLLGCRLFIINPPWQLADQLRPLLKHLWEIFSIEGQGSFSAYFSSR
jgi:23S rRNA (adenine2030-N6)-methyltransferase